MTDLAVKLAGNRAIIEPRTDAGRAFAESRLAPFRFPNGVYAASPGEQERELVALAAAEGITYSVERVV